MLSYNCNCFICYVFTLVVLAFGNSILKFVLDLNFFGTFGDKIYYLFLLLKWPIAIIFIYVVMKLIYTIAPDSIIKSECTTRGALFTSFAWIVSTFVYSYYVLHFSHYDIFYGSLSNIIVMMMWIYILAFSLVLRTRPGAWDQKARSKKQVTSFRNSCFVSIVLTMV